jgi:hypothetical protein
VRVCHERTRRRSVTVEFRKRGHRAAARAPTSLVVDSPCYDTCPRPRAVSIALHRPAGDTPPPTLPPARAPPRTFARMPVCVRTVARAAAQCGPRPPPHNTGHQHPPGLTHQHRHELARGRPLSRRVRFGVATPSMTSSPVNARDSASQKNHSLSCSKYDLV